MSSSDSTGQKLRAPIVKIQRFSLHDGPGVRTTVFLKGCPLGCKWCSNPETQSAAPELLIQRTLCDRCGKCVPLCPAESLRLSDGHLAIDRQRCTACGICAGACAREALSICGKEMTVGEVLAEIKKDAVFFDEEGGVTISGGEPLLYPDFLVELAAVLKQAGIPVILDTSGYADWKTVADVIPLFDEVFFDVKSLCADRHLAYTGVNNGQILENLKRIAAAGIPVSLRYPMIPSVNDGEADLRSLAALAKSLSQYKRVYLLPYHSFGSMKYDMLDLFYPMGDVKRHTAEQINVACAFLEAEGLRVQR